MSDQLPTDTPALFTDSEHHAEMFHARHFDDTVELWCPNLDETKVVLGTRYVRHCVMCGEAIEVNE